MSCTIEQFCQNGMCVNACGPSSCPSGCCQSNQCQPGTYPAACGTNGQPCVICQGNEICDNKKCTSSGGCTSSSCPTGCCQNNQCKPGTANDACGTGGNQCAVCQQGQSCTNKKCVGETACNNKSCPTGCCRNDQCQPGNTNGDCGTGGGTCITCTSMQYCLNKQCVQQACSPGNCPGCCSSAGCQPGNIDTACGANGQPCTACPSYKTCSGNQCQIKPISDWKVKVVNASIAVPPIGKDWDPGALPGFIDPDVYVELKSGGKSGKTGIEDNTYNPYWDEQVLSSVQAQALVASLQIKVYDDDPVPPDQLIGECIVQVSYGDLQVGQRTFNNCGGYHIIAIKLTFEAIP